MSKGENYVIPQTTYSKEAYIKTLFTQHFSNEKWSLLGDGSRLQFRPPASCVFRTPKRRGLLFNILCIYHIQFSLGSIFSSQVKN